MKKVILIPCVTLLFFFLQPQVRKYRTLRIYFH